MARARFALGFPPLTALLFMQGAALGIWFVPLSTILDLHGLESIKPFAFAASAVAAFVSPLIFGAMADRHASPVKVLRGLALATAAAMTIVSLAIQRHAQPWLVLALIQVQALCSSPTWSISSAVVFSKLVDAPRQFGPIRAMATLGWMAGCCCVSLLQADGSTRAGFMGATAWLLVCALTFLIPEGIGTKSSRPLSWSERLGLDALTLLKNRDHRVVFITTILFCIPLSAYYPYAPVHLRALGFAHTSAWMTLGQVTEIIAMMYLGRLLLKWRLKWIFACGLAFGVLRFGISSWDKSGTLLLGIFLHGFSFALVYITAQIYLDQRVEAGWRARAQALLTLMNSGMGNLLGYLGTGWWFSLCSSQGAVRWTLFWGGLSALTALLLGYFLVAYRGLRSPPPAREVSLPP